MTTESASERLGRNMKRIREGKAMTQGDICRAGALDRACVSTLEAGKRNPTRATIERIAKALDVSIDELMK